MTARGHAPASVLTRSPAFLLQPALMANPGTSNGRDALARLPFAAVVLGLTWLWCAAAAAVWGGWPELLANPARRGAVIVAFGLALVASFSPFNVSPGKRSDLSDLWIVLPAIGFTILLAWLPPDFDRRDRWVVDGDALRWLGVVLFGAGGALRLWPIFVLGRRFSALVAIQENHALVTDGPYRWIRNPSYLGGLVSTVGWVLVFRSVVGLLLAVPATWITVVRIRNEEALLASEFRDQYDAYRRRTWRLLPWVY